MVRIYSGTSAAVPAPAARRTLSTMVAGLARHLAVFQRGNARSLAQHLRLARGDAVPVSLQFHRQLSLLLKPDFNDW